MRLTVAAVIFGLAVTAFGGVGAATTTTRSAKVRCDDWVEEDFEGDLEQACGDDASWDDFKDERTCNGEQEQCQKKCCGDSKPKPDSDKDSSTMTCREWLADNRGDIEYACERDAGWISFKPFNYGGECLEEDCKETCCGE